MTPSEHYLFRQMKLRHLQLLVALADLQSVSKLARTLHVTQPAVSKMIAEIECGIGLSLFARQGHAIRPTVYGESLIRHAREILDRARRTQQELQALHDGVDGRIDVGVLHVAAPFFLPRVLGEFKQHLPHVTIGLHEGTLDRLLPRLRAWDIDLIVGRVSIELLRPDLSSTALFDDPIVLVVSSQHPLARKSKVRWADLEDQPWIVPMSSAPMHKHLMSMLLLHGLKLPRNVIESVIESSNLTLLFNGPMIALLPRSLAQHYVAHGQLHILPLPLEEGLGPVSIVWNAQRECSAAQSRFKQFVLEAAHPDYIRAGTQNGRDDRL
jgi:DNA-binding transcriptional LysR family regulator